MNYRMIGFLVCLMALATGPAFAGDTVVDKAEDVIETAKEFNNSSCGKAVKGCWKTVISTIKETNKACKAFRKCKQKCRTNKRSNKKACYADRCSKLSGKAKRDCKKGCRRGARLQKRSCRSKCGKRPKACRDAWMGVFKGIGKCVKSIKESDCKKWAQEIGNKAKNLK